MIGAIQFANGPDIPFIIQRRANEWEQRATYEEMSRHYNAWFQNGVWKRILDPQRARYLREHCGWDNLSEQQLKNESFQLLGFQDTRIAYCFNPDHQNFTLILDGKHRYTTQVGNYRMIHIDKFIQRILLPVPSLPALGTPTVVAV